GLEAFLAEHRAPLSWLEGHRGFLAAVGAGRHRFDPLACGAGTAGRPRGAFGFARLAALRFVLEVLVGEELLLSRRPDEFRATIHAPEDPVLELHRSLPRRGRSCRTFVLLQLSPELLAISLTRKRLLRAPLVSRFQIEGVLLNVLDDVFLLNL